MILGLSGLAGSGKSTVARILVTSHCFEEMSLAAPMKQFCQEIFGFTFDQLYGPSSFRNAVDPRYGKSPREALQTLGTDWARAFYENTWIDYALRKGMLQARGIRSNGLVISDVRFKNERDAIRKAGGKVWRIVRPGAGLTGETALHESETGLTDEDCDRIVDNQNGPLEDLHALVSRIVAGKS